MENRKSIILKLDKKKIIFASIAISLSFIITFIIAEIIIRLFFPENIIKTNPNSQKALLYGWGGEPFANIVDYNPDTHEKIIEQRNSQGWRDEEHKFNKEKGVKRVLFLGDSYTYGWGVKFNDIYTTKFNNFLPANFEIIRIGEGGWGTAQEFLALKYEGIKYNPDFVILAFHYNDVLDNLSDKPLGDKDSKTTRPKFDLIDNKLVLRFEPMKDKLTQKIKRYLLHHSAVLVKILLLKRILLMNYYGILKEEIKQPIFYDEYSQNIEVGWEITKAILKEINKLCKKHHAKFIVFPISNKQHFYFKEQKFLLNDKIIIIDNQKPFRILKDFCNKNSIEYINSLNIAKNLYEGKSLLFKTNDHWNEYGHEFMAKILYKHFKNNYYICEN